MKRATRLIGSHTQWEQGLCLLCSWKSEGVEIHGLYDKYHNKTINNEMLKESLWFFLFLFFFHHMVE
jgi:hypothetical protein